MGLTHDVSDSGLVPCGDPSAAATVSHWVGLDAPLAVAQLGRTWLEALTHRPCCSTSQASHLGQSPHFPVPRCDIRERGPRLHVRRVYSSVNIADFLKVTDEIRTVTEVSVGQHHNNTPRILVHCAKCGYSRWGKEQFLRVKEKDAA